MPSHEGKRVLVLGIYLLDTTNYAARISRALIGSRDWNVDVCWAAVGSGDAPEELRSITVSKTEVRISKFRLLNYLLEKVDLARYRYLIVTDDDIEFSEDFLDNYLYLVSKYDFALAQPARTHDSYIDHKFVAQLLGIEARLTRFVEIGPLFSVRQDAYSRVLPFDQDAPMGWGLDFVWPATLEPDGFRMGIVDAVPVKHALRKPVAFYDYEDTKCEMQYFLSTHDHLLGREAFIALETYPMPQKLHCAVDETR